MFGCLFQRIIIKVRITLGRCGLRVTEQLADDGKSKAGSRANGRMGMAQIVNPNPLEAGALGNGPPGFLEIRPRPFIVTTG